MTPPYRLRVVYHKGRYALLTGPVEVVWFTERLQMWGVGRK